MIGLNAPTIRTVGYTVAGMVGTPFVEGFASGFLPLAVTGNKLGSYAVKIASALAVGFAAGKILGREAGRAAYIGGAAYIAVSAIKEFFPALAPAGGGTGEYLGQQNQPLLGEYLGNSPITKGIPDRLQPGSRF